MKKEMCKKMKLNRETLRQLADHDVKAVLGGLLRRTMLVGSDCPCTLVPPNNG